MNFSKDNYTKTVGPFIPFHCVEILLYKKCTKPIYKLVNTKKETNSICRWNVTTVQMGYSELPIHDVFKICFKVTTDSNVQWFQYRTIWTSTSKMIHVHFVTMKLKLLNMSLHLVPL